MNVADALKLVEIAHRAVESEVLALRAELNDARWEIDSLRAQLADEEEA